ncbi:MAG: ABC transporter permease, partial [Bacillota bacterium]
MTTYILRRLVLLIPVLLGVAIIVFGMVRLLPGDPAVAMAGVHATPEYVEQVREDMGLNDSLIIQLGVFMKKLFKFDLGLSTRTQRPVSGEILPRFLNTLKLTVVALALTTIVGIGAGIISASKPY